MWRPGGEVQSEHRPFSSLASCDCSPMSLRPGLAEWVGKVTRRSALRPVIAIHVVLGGVIDLGGGSQASNFLSNAQRIFRTRMVPEAP